MKEDLNVRSRFFVKGRVDKTWPMVIVRNLVDLNLLVDLAKNRTI